MAGTAKATKVSEKVSKQKVLLPTLKEQQRYLVYTVLLNKGTVSTSVSFDKIHNDIIFQCTNLLGIFDSGLAGLMSAKYNGEKMSGVIRVNNKYVDKFKVCLGLIKTSNNVSITIECIYVSGVLNKALDKMNNC